MGVLGMSFEDFCLLTPKECTAACTAYREESEAREKSAWERMRLLANISIQPHIKKKITPRKMLPFPWDNGSGKKSSPDTHRENMRNIGILKSLMD